MVIIFFRGLSVDVALPDGGDFEDLCQIVGDHVFDGGIRTAGDLTGGDHIPQRNAMGKEKGLLFRNGDR